MSIERKNMVKIFFIRRLLFVSFFCWLSMSSVSYVLSQTDDIKTDSDQYISRDNNATNSEKPLVIKPVNTENTDSDQEKIGREAKAMIMEITQSNILYKNKIRLRTIRKRKNIRNKRF